MSTESNIRSVARAAKKIAEKAAGRPLHYEWLTLHESAEGYPGEYSVSYTLPHTHGFFITREKLSLSPAEAQAFIEWTDGRRAHGRRQFSFKELSEIYNEKASL